MHARSADILSAVGAPIFCRLSDWGHSVGCRTGDILSPVFQFSPEWGVENLEARVLRHQPDTVFIEFSINDSVARFESTFDAARRNLESMIDSILKTNPQCEIILMTMTPGDKHPVGHRSHRKDIDSHYGMYRAVAKERNLLLIDHDPTWKTLQLENKALFDTYVPDSIHATEEGCANVITPTILTALGSEPNKDSLATPEKSP